MYVLYATCAKRAKLKMLRHADEASLDITKLKLLLEHEGYEGVREIQCR